MISRLGLLLVVLVIPSALEAKCAFHKYVLEGAVLAESTRVPVVGARVFAFLDDYESTYADGYATKYPDYFVTSAVGRFRVKSYFNSFRTLSFFRGHVCDKEPERVEFMVTAPGFLTKRVTLSYPDLRHSRVSMVVTNVKTPVTLLKRSK